MRILKLNNNSELNDYITWHIGINQLGKKTERNHPHVDKQTPKSVLKYCRILVPKNEQTSYDVYGIPK